MSQDEIRAVYAQGEEAVVSLVTMLIERIEKLETEVKELNGKMSKNSRNSSKPPSSDGLKKRTKSLRRKSVKTSGGQPKHPGNTLEWSDKVDWVQEHYVSHCPGCGASLKAEPVKERLLRQIFDIPPIELEVTEHQCEVKCCPDCGQQNQGVFPTEASNVVQYGPRLKGMMVYFMEHQLLPSARTVETLTDILGVQISEGTLYNTRAKCFKALEQVDKAIQDRVLNSAVVHFDETGFRVNGKLWWLHVAATNGLSYYFIHPRRGQAAMDEMQILPQFTGKAIHDGLKSYAGYGCEHFLCNAHHLRELQFILERYEQFWAFQMSLLLVTIHRHVQVAKGEGHSALSPTELKAFDARYETILEDGFRANPVPTVSPGSPKKRGRPKQSPPRNFLNRLRIQKASVLGFMYDFEVPFDNNQAERDLRMMKLKQKISGSFRSQDGAEMFCRIRGYLSTLRKQGHNVMDALTALFSGKSETLLLQPE